MYDTRTKLEKEKAVLEPKADHKEKQCWSRRQTIRKSCAGAKGKP